MRLTELVLSWLNPRRIEASEKSHMALKALDDTLEEIRHQRSDEITRRLRALFNHNSEEATSD